MTARTWRGVAQRITGPKKRTGMLTVLSCAVLAACASTVTPPDDVSKSKAYLQNAIEDVEVAARRARAFRSANIWDRADKELDSAKLILYNALRERERVRRVYRAAVAVLEEAKQQDTAVVERGDAREKTVDVTAAANRVDRIGEILSAADRDVEIIQEVVAALDQLDIPNRL